MRRPQKSFVVEVKRARKGAAAKVFGAEPHKIEADPTPDPTQKGMPTPETAPLESPPRRILETIDVPAPDLSQPEPIVANTPIRRPRGRPPKSVSAAGVLATKKPRVATKAPRVPIKASPAPAARKTIPLAEISAALAAPSALGAPAPAAHVWHGDRSQVATSLPRGERWKRRLPRVLW